MNCIQLITIALFSSLIVSTWAEFCPQAELLDPCECHKDPDTNKLTLYCSDYRFNTDDLNALFKRLNGRGLKFHEFDLMYAGSYFELGANAFGDVQFEKITIGIGLYKIHKLAFNGTQNNLISFVSVGVPNPTDDNNNIIAALNTATNLRYIDITGNGLYELPDHAFDKLDYLRLVRIAHGTLRKVGSNILTGYHDGIVVDLSHNKLNTVAKDAFNNQRVFHLNVSYNELNEQNFHTDLFHIDFADPVTVDIRGNGFKHLPEATFKWLLNLKAKSGVGPVVMADPLDCQACENYWLFADDKYAKNFPVFHCSDGQQFDYRKHFHNC